MLFITDQTIKQRLSFKAGRPDVDLKNNPADGAVCRSVREAADACISCDSLNGAPYLALPVSRMIGLEGEATPERADKARRAVYALDCNELDAVYDSIKGRCYFLPARTAVKPG